MDWNTELISEIRDQKQREQSTDRDALLEIASVHLYGEKIHYALEMIQNAEDAGAKSITFIFHHDHAVVINDGAPFEADDVWGICSVRPGRKKNKIGFFGIGFKSVYNITDRPQIISSTYNFAIEEKIYPYPGEPLPDEILEFYRADQGSIFVLPFSDRVTDFNELIEQFDTLDEKLLLFLNSVKCIRFIDRVNDRNWEITKQQIAPDTFQLDHPGKSTKESWKVFHHDIPVKPEIVTVPEGKFGIEQTRVTVAFSCDDQREDTGTTKVANVAYCYLPTKKRTDLNFLIQADFLPTVGRETLAEAPWNDWLLGQIGFFAADCVEKLRSSLSTEDLLEIIPLRTDIQDPQMLILYTEMRSRLVDKKFVQSQNNHFISTKVSAYPRDEKVRRLIGERDLSGILGERRSYVKPLLSSRAKEVLSELDAYSVGEPEVISLIKQETRLKGKDEAWFLDLYDFLASYFVNSKYPQLWDELKQDHFRTFCRAKCMLTTQKRLVAPKDPSQSDRMMCYSGIANLAEIGDLFTDDELVILHPFFQVASITGRKEINSESEEKRERVKEFLDTLDIRRHFRQFHVINQIILPKFRNGTYKAYNTDKLYRYMNYIRNNIDSYEIEVKRSRPAASKPEDIFREIVGSVKIRGFIQTGRRQTEVYLSPNDLYFSKAYGKSELMEDLFRGVGGIAYLSPYYINRGKKDGSKARSEGLRRKPGVSWRQFFERLGVWSCPRIVKSPEAVSIAGKEGYEWISKEYSTHGQHEIVGDHISPEIVGLLTYLNQKKTPIATKNRLSLLWEVLEKNWNRVYKAGCKSTYRYYHYGSKDVSINTSSFLELLRRWKWVPTVDGGFNQPRQVYLNTENNRRLLGESNNFTNLNGNKTFLDDILVRVEPNPKTVVGHLISLSQEGNRETNNLSESNAIYSFLRDRCVEDADLEEMSKQFEANRLIYLPRADKNWWAPKTVFWQEFSKLFGDKRGYIEQDGIQFYSNGLKDFMLALGVRERPSIMDCLAFVRDLKINNGASGLKSYALAVYVQLDDLSKMNNFPKEGWSVPLFLSENGEFLRPEELYIPDNEDQVNLFGDQLDFMFLPCLHTSIPNFLREAEFVSLVEHTEVSKTIEQPEELDSGVVQNLLAIIEATETYLKGAFSQGYNHLLDAGAFEVIRSLSILQASSIQLTYTTRHLRLGQDVKVQSDSSIFLSQKDNSLWVTRGIELFSTEIAKQLSTLFYGVESQAFSFLDSLMQTRGDPEGIRSKLLAHGIAVEADSEAGQSGTTIEILPEVEGEKIPGTDSTKVGTPPNGADSDKPIAPTAPSVVNVTNWLINPNEFIEDEEEERIPYNKSEVNNQPAVKKRVKLGPGKPSSKRPERKLRFKVILSKLSTEDVSLELVMRHEEENGNFPDDRHEQRGIGYDIYSTTPLGEERFIEVKGFQDDNGVLNFPRNEWVKAEEAKESFYAYIVTGLRVGGSPKLWEIRNPTKYLTPDSPEDKQVGDWQHAVAKMTTFKKV